MIQHTLSDLKKIILFVLQSYFFNQIQQIYYQILKMQTYMVKTLAKKCLLNTLLVLLVLVVLPGQEPPQKS